MMTTKHKLRFLFLINLILCSFISFSQTKWDSVGVLSEGNGVRVFLLFKEKSDSCEPNSSKISKYKYYIDGTPTEENLFLNWKFDYLTCNKAIKIQTNSYQFKKSDANSEVIQPEYQFEGYKIVSKFHDVNISGKPDNTPLREKSVNKSISAESILHKYEVFEGENTNLSVNGGKLANGAKWVWYKDNLKSIPIGIGEKIQIVPDASSRYFVRAEGINDTSYSKFILLIAKKRQSNVIYTEKGWDSPGLIHSGNGVNIYLLYKEKLDSCEPNSFKTSKYKYYIDGTPFNTNLYLNWKIDYLTCSGIIKTQTNYYKFSTQDANNEVLQPEYTFEGYKVVVPFHDVKISDKPDNTPVKEKGGVKSVVADKILHEEEVFQGEKTTLKISGGKLGIGAKWVWYRDNVNGAPIDIGEQISVVLQNSTTFYVRAEGLKDTTSTIQASVKVTENSIIGKVIEGPNFICKGQKNIQLSLIDGKLGKNAEWKWYKDDCGGKSIGTGRSIEVSPLGKTIYYVRAEGTNGITECLKKEILISDISQKPEKIIGTTNLCEGASTTLSITGGKLANGSKWIWYKNELNVIDIIGEGISVSISPEKNSEYFVRAEGACYNTEPIAKKVIVNHGSINPYEIEVEKFGIVNRIPSGKYRFKLYGGSLAEGSKWVWYNNANQKKIGEGNSIKYRFKKNTTFKIKAEGGVCDNLVNSYEQQFSLNEEHSYNTRNANNYLNFGLVSSKFTANSTINPFSPINLVLSYANIIDENIGWYVKGKICINGMGKSDFQTKDNGVIKTIDEAAATVGNLIFNGNVIEERYGATFGVLVGTDHVKLFLGGGWGKRELKWGLDEYQYNQISGDITKVQNAKWASNTDRNYEGVELETGLIFNFSIFNIQVGASNISTASPSSTTSTNQQASREFKYFDTHIGIGFNF